MLLRDPDAMSNARMTGLSTELISSDPAQLTNRSYGCFKVDGLSSSSRVNAFCHRVAHCVVVNRSA